MAQAPLWTAPIHRIMATSEGNHPMTQTQINDAIALAFYNISQLSEQLYDFWLSELYDAQGEMIVTEWNERNLKLMEDDVMNETLCAS